MTAHPFALVPACAVYLIRGDQVLLQQRQNTGLMDGYWGAGAAGHVDPGETARQAAIREAREEIAVTIAPAHLQLATVMQRTNGTNDPRQQRIDWFWTCHEWAGEPALQEPHKAADLRWFDLSALPEPLPGYERLVLHNLASGRLHLDTAFGFDR